MFKSALALIALHTTTLLACATYTDALVALNSIGLNDEEINHEKIMSLVWEQDIVTSAHIQDLRSFYRVHLSAGMMMNQLRVDHKNDDAAIFAYDYAYYFNDISPKVRHWKCWFPSI